MSAAGVFSRGEAMTDPATEPTTNLNRSLIILGVAISLMHIWFNVVTVLSSLWQNSLHFAGFARLASLVYPLRKNPTIAWRALDILLGLLAAGSALYLIAMEDAIYARGVRMVPAEWVAGIILILCALEFTTIARDLSRINQFRRIHCFIAIY
jgi:TRAP-type uncharacterized transport system fused permease subunit